MVSNAESSLEGQTLRVTSDKGTLTSDPRLAQLWRRLARRNWFLLWLVPLTASVLAWAIIPFLSSLVLSFTNYRIGSPLNMIQWVGLHNFKLALTDTFYAIALRNTIFYVAVGVPVKNMLALLIAQLLFSLKRAKSFFRTCAFLPVVTPPLAAIILFKYLFQHQFGLFNQALLFLGLPRVRWITSALWVKPSIIGMTIWNYLGYPTIVLLAGLGTIPEAVREAARIDGADSWHVFWNINWPLLRLSLAYVLVTDAINWLQIFTQPYVLVEGGPYNSSLSAVMWIRDIGITQSRGGAASAFSFVLFAIILTLTLLQLRFFRVDWEY